jgi:hypothetical protein
MSTWFRNLFWRWSVNRWCSGKVVHKLPGTLPRLNQRLEIRTDVQSISIYHSISPFPVLTLKKFLNASLTRVPSHVLVTRGSIRSATYVLCGNLQSGSMKRTDMLFNSVHYPRHWVIRKVQETDFLWAVRFEVLPAGVPAFWEGGWLLVSSVPNLTTVWVYRLCNYEEQRDRWMMPL